MPVLSPTNGDWVSNVHPLGMLENAQVAAHRQRDFAERSGAETAYEPRDQSPIVQFGCIVFRATTRPSRLSRSVPDIFIAQAVDCADCTDDGMSHFFAEVRTGGRRFPTAGSGPIPTL